MKRCTTVLALTLTLALALPSARAQSNASEASGLSMLPVAVSVTASSLALSAGATLVIVTVESTARGTVWVLERASDGARMSLQFTGKVLEGSATLSGTVVVVTAIGSGYVLSAAGQAIAFVPNEIGASLLYNEQITK